MRLRELWKRVRHPRWRWIWWGTGLSLYISSSLLTPLPPQARQTFAIFVLASFLWGTHSLPLPVTGLVVLFLLPTSGALEHRETYAHFTSPAVMFVLGALILASPVVRSGLSSRMALAVVSRLGNTPRRLITAVYTTALMLSMVINEHAVAAMMFPIVFEMAYASRSRPGDPLSSRLFLAMAWGCIVGGTTTLLGGARAPLAIGMLQSTTGEHLGFITWSMAAFPAVIILYVMGWILLQQGLPDQLPESLLRDLHQKVQTLGKPSSREIRTSLILTLTVFLWMFRGDQWGLDSIALLGVILAFLSGVATWREVEEDVNWGIFIMYGSAMALGTALETSGVTSMLAHYILNAIPLTPQELLIGLGLLSLVLTEMVSNVATVAILIPIGLALAHPLGIPGTAVVLSVAYPAGLAFLLPVSTPALAIATGGNYLFPRQIFLSGLVMKGVSIMLVLVLSVGWWPQFTGG